MNAFDPRINRLTPVAPGAPRPRWSVMIPVYNAARYLGQTLRSVLDQALPESDMEIVVVDDCSDDDPAAVVAACGSDRVRYVRQERNLGHRGNFETCLRLSRGDRVHLLHGDDYVRPGFYAACDELFGREPSLGAVFCRHVYVDESGQVIEESPLHLSAPGVWSDFGTAIAYRQLVQTPSIVVRRRVYETVGMFHPDLSWCEDWEMWARTASCFPVGFVPQTLACYRMHTASNTGRYAVSAENSRDLRRAIDIIHRYVPDRDKALEAKRHASRFYARQALRQAKALQRKQLYEGVRNQLREAFHLSDEPAFMLVVLARYLMSWVPGLQRVG